MEKLMSRSFLTLALLSPIAIVSVPTPVMAHEDSKGPHGGTVKEFGSYHVEGILEGGMVKFYLLDGDGAKLTSGDVAGGALTVISAGGSPKVTKIEKGKFSEASASAEGKKVTASLVLKIGGKSQSAKFTFK